MTNYSGIIKKANDSKGENKMKSYRICKEYWTISGKKEMSTLSKQYETEKIFFAKHFERCGIEIECNSIEECRKVIAEFLGLDISSIFVMIKNESWELMTLSKGLTLDHSETYDNNLVYIAEIFKNN